NCPTILARAQACPLTLIRLSLSKLPRLQKEGIAVFLRQEIEKASRGIVRRRVPVGGAGESGASARALCRGLHSGSNRPALSIDSLGPVQFFHERKCGEKFSVGAVQDIEIAVAIRFEEQLSLLALVAGIDQDGSLRRVVVKEVVRRKLEIPFELSRVGVQGDDTIGIEVVPRARAAIKVRSGIAGAPINCIEFRIVRAGHPGSAAPALVEFAGPA